MQVEQMPWRVLGWVGFVAVLAWLAQSLVGRTQDYLVAKDRIELDKQKEQNKAVQLQNNKVGENLDAIEKRLTALLSAVDEATSVVARKASEAQGFLEAVRRAGAQSK